MTTYLVGALLIIALCAIAFAFSGSDSGRSKKRLAAIRGQAGNAGSADLERRKLHAVKNVREENAKAKRADLERRIERAGLTITTKNYWIASGVAGAVGGI